MLKTYIFLFFSWVVVSAYSFEVNLTGSIEPLFYSTGDYTSYAYTSAVNIFPAKYFGAEISYSQFHYQDDKIYYYDELKSNFVNLSAIVKSSTWKRQKFGIVAGLSVHRYELEKNTVTIGAPDYDKISEFIDNYFTTHIDYPEMNPNDYRLRAKMVDSTGRYQIGISHLTENTLLGLNTSLLYEVNPFQTLWIQFLPKFQYFPGENILVWSMGIGISVPIYEK